MENSESYKRRVKAHSPHSKLLKNTLSAFLFGGIICLFGEIIANIYLLLSVKSEDVYIWVTITLILISALMTGLGVFDKIARHAGAGTLVPVTGFANSVVSCAIDNKAEGYVLGVGAKIFTVAGPVILFSLISGFIYGLIYYFLTLFI